MSGERVQHWRSDEPPSVDELTRSMARIESVVNDLDAKFDAAAIAAAQGIGRIERLEADVEKLQASQTWAWRAVAIAVLQGVISMAVAVIVWVVNQ